MVSERDSEYSPSTRHATAIRDCGGFRRTAMALGARFTRTGVLVALLVLALPTGFAAATDGTETWFQRGVAYDDAGEYDRAVEAFENVLRVEPAHADAWYRLGFAHFSAGNRIEGLEAMQKAFELDPTKEADGYFCGSHDTCVG